MILNDTVMNDYERVKKWREKNRARYNLYQRNRRKVLKVPVQVAEPIDGASEAHAIPEGRTAGSSPATGATSTLEYLRGLEKAEREKTRVEAPVRLPVRRSETGMIISEEQYQEREEYKRRSREKGFVPDEYSQA